MSAYVVVGAGAIGGTVGAQMLRAGHDVLFCDADAEHVAAINERGLAIDGPVEQFTVEARAVAPDDLPDELGAVLLAVKAQHTAAALEAVLPRLASDGFVVSLQNGLNEDAIAARVGAGRTVGAFVNLFADVVGPGVIRDGGLGALVVGEMDGSTSARVQSVVQDLQSWGPARATTNVSGYLWSKLGFGAMLTATALADAPMADLIDAHRPMMYRLTAEVFAVAKARGIALEPFDAFDPAPYAGEDVGAKDRATDRLVAWLRTQSKDRSGIWRDLAVRHRPTEVPTHYGAVLDAAASAGVDIPLVRDLLRQIGELEAGAAMSQDRLDALGTVTA